MNFAKFVDAEKRGREKRIIKKQQIIEELGCHITGKHCRSLPVTVLVVLYLPVFYCWPSCEYSLCGTANMLYLLFLFCAKCSGAQCVGETRNTLELRPCFYLHRSHIKKSTGTHHQHFMRCLPTEQILTDDHFKRQGRDFGQGNWHPGTPLDSAPCNIAYHLPFLVSLHL